MASYTSLLFLSALFLCAQSFNSDMTGAYNSELSAALRPEESQAPCVPKRAKVEVSMGRTESCTDDRVRISYTVFIRFGNCIKSFYTKKLPCRVEKRAMRKFARSKHCLLDSVKRCNKIPFEGKQDCVDDVVNECCARTDITRFQ